MNKPTLLPPSAQSFERHAEQAAARLEDVPPSVRPVWSPDDCPEPLLPWLAWALGVEDWRDYWTEATKRDVIRQSIPIRRLRGTRAAVAAAIAPFGAHMIIREWWETTPPGVPHTFQVIIIYGGLAVTAAMQDDVVRQITRAKPLRSHFTVSVGLSAAAQLNVCGYVRAGTYNRLALQG